MQSLQFSANVENDLLEAWLYVAKDNPLAADSMLDQIKIGAESLLSQPLMGRARGELASSMIDDLVAPHPFPKIQPIHVSEQSSMIASIKDFFSQFIEPGITSSTSGTPTLQIATAALLIEMMRMDSELREAERQAIASTLQTQFNLDTAQFETLIALAEQEARNATDYYQFTSLINKHCDLTQKVQIIENLWHVAMIDGHLDAHELHLMRKLADLLYVGHADYVAAKQRARDSAKLPV